MSAIEITQAQRDYLENLQSELSAEHVGAYGHVRPLDAVQFLIDQYENDNPASGSAGDNAENEAQTNSGNADDAADPEDRLQAMMDLLEDHDDKWTETEGDEGKYAVTLPDGSTETVRTKDDVRALLFQHY